MNKIIVANWKMNPQTLPEAQALFVAELATAAKYSTVQTIICPPFVYLEELAKLLPSNGVKLGAQDIFWEAAGAFTGEISPAMLQSFKVDYVLVGHSDRRYVVGESDEIINRKIKAALAADITPILLVGEKEVTDVKEDVLIDQLSRDLEGLTADDISKVLIGYEPVWAISTVVDAQPDTPENALVAIKFIKNTLASSFPPKADPPLADKFPNIRPILYGGSVNEKNVTSFLSHPEIGGAVVGGASLRPEEFTTILDSVSNLE